MGTRRLGRKPHDWAMGATMGAARGGYGGAWLGERRPGCGAADPRKVYGQSQLMGSRCDFHK